jgi:hypothetical protein
MYTLLGTSHISIPNRITWRLREMQYSLHIYFYRHARLCWRYVTGVLADRDPRPRKQELPDGSKIDDDARIDDRVQEILKTTSAAIAATWSPAAVAITE